LPTFTLTKSATSPQNSDISVEELRKEIDGFYVLLNSFSERQPEEIFVTISALTARASQIRNELVRRLDDRYLQNFRTKEVDPFLDECDRQFKIWSRVFSSRQLDWDISRGQS